MHDCPLVFFSFVALDGGGEDEHRRYNEWHQLDHRPENLALPGVAWGDRWGRTAQCRAVSRAEPEHQGTDYVAMYWFRAPVRESVRAWEQLGVDSFQWGRGPTIPGVRRTVLAFFRPVKGYSAASSLVSPGVIPYRPNRGVHLTMTRFTDPLGARTHEHHRWEDRVLVPALLDIDGVAGAWTFALDRHQDNVLGLRTVEAVDPPGGLRIRLVYVDGDPVDTAARIDDCSARLADRMPGEMSAEVVIETPLRTIVPWQDW